MRLTAAQAPKDPHTDILVQGRRHPAQQGRQPEQAGSCTPGPLPVQPRAVRCVWDRHMPLISGKAPLLMWRAAPLQQWELRSRPVQKLGRSVSGAALQRLCS